MRKEIRCPLEIRAEAGVWRSSYSAIYWVYERDLWPRPGHLGGMCARIPYEYRKHSLPVDTLAVQHVRGNIFVCAHE